VIEGEGKRGNYRGGEDKEEEGEAKGKRGKKRGGGSGGKGPFRG